MIDIVVITGPTASGKTDLSLKLAEKYPIEIISADSRQVFKYMDIGTAKPSKEELEKIPHHFIDIVTPDEYYSAGKFGEEAYQKVKEIIARDKVPIVVGGSGLYIKALVEGLFDEDPSEELLAVREELHKILKEKGKKDLLDELKKVDPASFEKYSDGNHRRIIRALSFYRLNGKPISEVQQEMAQERDITPRYFGIEHSREELYQRINLRTEQMWENGFVEEVESLLDMGYFPKLNSLDSVGYKECIQFLQGKISKEEAISEMQKFTRRFAKRQLTWIRNQTQEINWLQPNENSDIIRKVEKVINTWYDF